jgi:hypothetical protein
MAMKNLIQSFNLEEHWSRLTTPANLFQPQPDHGLSGNGIDSMFGLKRGCTSQLSIRIAESLTVCVCLNLQEGGLAMEKLLQSYVEQLQNGEEQKCLLPGNRMDMTQHWKAEEEAKTAKRGAWVLEEKYVSPSETSRWFGWGGCNFGLLMNRCNVVLA